MIIDDLPIGYHDVARGRLATIVTCLEMFEPPLPLPEKPLAAREFRRVGAPDAEWYRDLFRRIGEPYLWSSRLTMAPDELRGILQDPLVEVYALVRAEREDDEGLLELDFRVAGECELSFLGVSPQLVGSGAGSSLMNRAQARVWSGPTPVRRFGCTHAHLIIPRRCASTSARDFTHSSGR